MTWKGTGQGRGPGMRRYVQWGKTGRNWPTRTVLFGEIEAGSARHRHSQVGHCGGKISCDELCDGVGLVAWCSLVRSRCRGRNKDVAESCQLASAR